jgi:hypothetical protein
MANTRQTAIDWWGNIEYRNLLASRYIPNYGQRNSDSLTGREIEVIWRNANFNCA